MSVIDKIRACNGISNKLLGMGFPFHNRSGCAFYMIAYYNSKGETIYKHTRRGRDMGVDLAPYIQDEYELFIQYIKKNREDLIAKFKKHYSDPKKWYNVTSEEVEAAVKENMLSACKQASENLEKLRSFDKWCVGPGKWVKICEMTATDLKTTITCLQGMGAIEGDYARRAWIIVMCDESCRRKKLAKTKREARVTHARERRAKRKAKHE